MAELKPCPFCGGASAERNLGEHNCVTCWKCGIDGPKIPVERPRSKQEAAELWNTRADSQIAAAYALDRAEQYNDGSGCKSALEEFAQQLQDGEHLAAYAHGELDATSADSARLAELEQENADLCYGVRRVAERITERDAEVARLTAERDAAQRIAAEWLTQAQDLSREVERLREENEGLHSGWNGASASMSEMEQERDEARAQVARLQEGLGFYADARNYRTRELRNPPGATLASYIATDLGQRARALLDELGKGRA